MSQPVQDLIEVPLHQQHHFLAPIIVNDLIRLGNRNDGGYIVSSSAIRDSDCLISLGLSYDWTFDEDFLKLNPQITIHAYDYSVSESIFRKNFIKALCGIFIFKSSLKRLKRKYQVLISYKKFFSSNAKHYEERITGHPTLPYDVNLKTALDRVSGNNIFLKMDIEGSEYEIVDQIIFAKERIIGMAVEFHETDIRRNQFIKTIKDIQNHYEIVHIHANNYASIADDFLPKTLEISFLRKDRVQGTEKRKDLPLDIDAPCKRGIPDYALQFI